MAEHQSQYRSLSRAQKWLVEVQQKYIAGDTLEYLIFTFKGDEPSIVNELETVKSLPELYNLVRDRLYNGDRERALSRIVYTLDLAGHRRFGKRATGLLANTEFNVTISEYDPREASMLVQWYQCLMQIGIRLSIDEEEALRTHLTAELLPGTNPHAKDDLRDLFLYLVQTQRLAPDRESTRHVQTMVSCLGKANADHFKKFVKEYCHRNLPSSLFSHIFPDDPDLRSSVTVHQQDLSDFDIVTQDDVLQEKDDAGNENDRLLSSAENPRDKTTANKQCVALAVIAFILAVAACITIGPSIYGLHHAITHGSLVSIQLVYGGSAIRLYEFSPYYVTEVSLIKELRHEDTPHTIHFSLVDNCDDIPTNRSTGIPVSGTNTSHINNITAVYLLSGSEMNFNICAVADRPANDARVEVFVLNNLASYRYFDPREDPVYENVPVCDREPCECQEIPYIVMSSGYYSVVFLQSDVSLSVQYTYTVTLQQVEIALPLSSVLQECSDSHCTFPIDSVLPHDLTSVQCIIADIEQNAGGEGYQHVRVGSTQYNAGLVTSIVFLVVGLALALLIVLLVVGCHCRQTNKH